ncbi:POK18 protein, partial [Dasyornis broadbenti]|nr:POK18 protein [Dasyornis broadbenti]
RHVEKHLYASFAVLGVPVSIKTDNGPAYASAQFQRLCNLWGIRHDTGIPHNPTRQAIVERAHQA